MAGNRFNAQVSVTTATATLTLAQLIAATNQRVKVERIRVSGKGTLNTDAPVLIEVLKQTTAGTSSALTLTKIDDNAAETLQVTALQTFTVEPTAGNIKAAQAVHPQSSYDFVFPPGRELWIKGGERLGVRANTPAQAATFVVSIEGEE